MMAEKKTNDPLDFDPAMAKFEAADFLTYVTAVTIEDEATWIAAREKRRKASLLEKRAEKYFEVLYEPHKTAIKNIKTGEYGENAIVESIEAGCEQLDPKILAYENELRREREELQKMLEDQALQKALDDQEDLAKQLEAKGDQDGAKAVRERKPFVPSVVLPEWNYLLDGENRLDVWRCEVDEENGGMIALLKAIIEGKQPMTLIQLNSKVTGSMAKALKQTMKIPGLKAVKDVSITQR
jgi:hypothetical protein